MKPSILHLGEIGKYKERHIFRERGFQSNQSLGTQILRLRMFICVSWTFSLESRGIRLSESGMEVKALKRFNREDYVDAIQRHASSLFLHEMGS